MDEMRMQIALVVDTDALTGTFERELCAAMFGAHDHTSASAEAEARRYRGPSFEEMLVSYDDNGTSRFAARFPTPQLGGAWCSVCVLLERLLTEEELAGVKHRAQEFMRRRWDDEGRPQTPKILGYRYLKKVTLCVFFPC